MTHHITTRHPMTEARRQHLHGPLVSDLPPLRPLREAMVVGFAIAVFFAAVWFVAVVS